jgi:beta-glucosidase
VAYNDGADLAKAAALAKASEVAIVFVNEPTSEGRDMASLTLTNKQDDLVNAVAAANPHTVVVLETGGPALMPWIGKVNAALEIWYPGVRGAEAMANVLFGDVNPSGKLPITFPMSDADLPHPMIPGGRGPRPASEGASAAPVAAPAPAPGGGRAAPRDFDADYTVEGLNVGYKWFDSQNKAPLFPFGHGLSYTTFAYSGLKATTDSVSFTVRNTGKRAGMEVAQVYVRLPAAAKEPPQRLVAWEKVQLGAGESKTVTLKLEPKFLSIFNEQKDGWEFLPGEYKFFVGGSSRSTPLSATASH